MSNFFHDDYISLIGSTLVLSGAWGDTAEVDLSTLGGGSGGDLSAIDGLIDGLIIDIDTLSSISDMLTIDVDFLSANIDANRVNIDNIILDTNYLSSAIDGVNDNSNDITFLSAVANQILTDIEEKTVVVDSGTTTTITCDSKTTYFIITNTNTVTCSPPTSPTNGDIFRVTDISGNANANNIIVDFMGSSTLYHGTSSNVLLDIDNDTLEFIYTGSTYGWVDNT